MRASGTVGTSRAIDSTQTRSRESSSSRAALVRGPRLIDHPASLVSDGRLTRHVR